MNMQAMLKQAQKMQKDMMKTQEEINNTVFFVICSLISVKVKGTKDYSVSFEIVNGVPRSMKCSCPYSVKGDI